MTSFVQLLLCLTVLLVVLSSEHTVVASKFINCRKFVYHPKCRGVAAKRAGRPTVSASPGEPDADRKQDEEIVPETEYLPVTVDLGNDVVPRRPWTFLPIPAVDRNLPGLLLARRKLDTDTLDASYDYE